MSNIISVIQKAKKRCDSEKWPKMYWAIDLHNTIIPSSSGTGKNIKEFYPYAKETLQILSKRKDCCLILFTSTYPNIIGSQLDNWFLENGIVFKYLNENPECESTSKIDFSKKFYYDVLLDDKAGFDISDWLFIHFEVETWR